MPNFLEGPHLGQRKLSSDSFFEIKEVIIVGLEVERAGGYIVGHLWEEEWRVYELFVLPLLFRSS